MKRKPAITELEPQTFAVGETVLINRPHLWAGAVGEVVSFKDGLHRIKIPCKDKDGPTKHFHTDVLGSQLEIYI